MQQLTKLLLRTIGQVQVHCHLILCNMTLCLQCWKTCRVSCVQRRKKENLSRSTCKLRSTLISLPSPKLGFDKELLKRCLICLLKGPEDIATKLINIESALGEMHSFSSQQQNYWLYKITVRKLQCRICSAEYPN